MTFFLPVGCKTGLVKSLSQITDEKIMFLLAQVMEVTDSEACVSNTTGKIIFAKLEYSMYFIKGLKNVFAPVVHQTVVSFEDNKYWFRERK